MTEKLRLVIRAFSHRNFLLYWSGFAISLVGTWMQTLAQGWLVWRLSHSAFLLGVVGAVSQLPTLLLGSIGGVLVDRAPKKRVLYITQTGLAVAALTLATVTYLNVVTVPMVISIALISGIFAAVDAPARMSFIHDLVGKEDLPNAVALNATTFNAARLIGPSIAGFIVPFVGEEGCFLFNGISFFALIIQLTRLKDLPRHDIERKHERFLKAWHEAFEYIRTSSIHRPLMINSLVFGMFGFAHTVLMPVFADKVLGIGVQGLGMLMGMIGIGALIGGLYQAALPPGSRRGRLVVFGALGLGISATSFALSRNLTVSMTLLSLAGFTGTAMMASTNTLLQTLAPDHLRGRVMGFYTTCFLGISPIGHFIVGSMAQKIGAPYTMAIVSFLCVIVASLTVARNKLFRTI